MARLRPPLFSVAWCSSGRRSIRRTRSAAWVRVDMAEKFRQYLIEVTQDLPEQEARELLELILAAASLDLSLTVLCSGSARAMLEGSGAGRWRQLIEQDLAILLWAATDEDPGVSPAGLPRLAGPALEALRQDKLILWA